MKLKAKKTKMAELIGTSDQRPYAGESELMGSSRILPRDPSAHPLPGLRQWVARILVPVHAVASVPGDVQQWAGEQQKEGPPAEEVSPVLGEKEESDNGENADPCES